MYINSSNKNNKFETFKWEREIKNRRIDADHISNEIGEFKKGGDVFFNYGYGSDLVEQFYLNLMNFKNYFKIRKDLEIKID